MLKVGCSQQEEDKKTWENKAKRDWKFNSLTFYGEVSEIDMRIVSCANWREIGKDINEKWFRNRFLSKTDFIVFDAANPCTTCKKLFSAEL